jgi:hypothetical protein
MSMRPMGLPPFLNRPRGRARAAFPGGSLPMRLRDHLGEVFDEHCAAARRYGSSRASVGGSGHSRLNTPLILTVALQARSAWSAKCLITPRLCPARWP